MSLPRRTVVLVALAAGGLVLLAAGQTWVHATGLGSGAVSEVTANGSDASGVTSAMAFVVLAAGLALTIARRIGRWVVGILLVLAGATLAVTAVQAVADPEAAAEPAVAAATGTTAAAAAYAVTLWPWVAAAGGVLAVLAGAAALVAGGRWTHSRRFEAPGAQAGAGTTAAAPAHVPAAVGTAGRDAAAAADDASAARPTTAAGGPAVEDAGRRGDARPHDDAQRPDEEDLDPMDAWDELSAGNDPTR